MGKNRNQRNHNANRRLAIRIFLISLAVAVGIGGWQIYLFYATDGTSTTNYETYIINPPLETDSELVDGEYGDTYTNLSAGFTVKKPNENWHFIKNVPNYRANELGLDTTQAHVGSVIVKNPEFATIVIGVQISDERVEMPNDLEFTIDNWFDYGIEKFTGDRGLEYETIERYSSPENDYGFMKSITYDSEFEEYHFKTVRVYNEKIFEIHQASILPEKFPANIIQDIDFIFKSYKILP